MFKKLTLESTESIELIDSLVKQLKKLNIGQTVMEELNELCQTFSKLTVEDQNLQLNNLITEISKIFARRILPCACPSYFITTTLRSTY